MVWLLLLAPLVEGLCQTIPPACVSGQSYASNEQVCYQGWVYSNSWVGAINWCPDDPRGLWVNTSNLCIQYVPSSTLGSSVAPSSSIAPSSSVPLSSSLAVSSAVSGSSSGVVTPPLTDDTLIGMAHVAMFVSGFALALWSVGMLWRD